MMKRTNRPVACNRCDDRKAVITVKSEYLVSDPGYLGNPTQNICQKCYDVAVQTTPTIGCD